MIRDVLSLTTVEREELESRCRSRRLRAEDARRARLVLMLARGESYAAVQAALGCDPGYVSRWKRRFEAERSAGLYSRHRGSKAKSPLWVMPLVPDRAIFSCGPPFFARFEKRAPEEGTMSGARSLVQLRHSRVTVRATARFASPLASLACVFALAARPAQAQAEIKINDTTFMKLGVLLQSWADWQELASADGTTTTGYAQNLFIRRARLVIAGQLVKDVTFFYQMDNSNLGRNKTSSTALASGFNTLDAWGLWKVAPGFQPQVGIFIVPFSRNEMGQASSRLTLDVSPLAFLGNAQTESNGFRDTGLGAIGSFMDDHLQYRTGVFQGERLAGSRNPLRYAGRVQYEFFDPETTYAYPGTNLGKNKVVAVGAGSDNQGAYHAYTADFFADIPVSDGDAATGSGAWLHYDGQTRFTSLPRQNDYLFEAAYYVSRAKVQPFLQMHLQRFSDAVNEAKDANRYQGGFNYYVHGRNLKLTAAYTRLVPKVGVRTNEFTIQLQIYYY
jgi:Helix-turn-helix domain/Phosphate-selective porin O and P